MGEPMTKQRLSQYISLKMEVEHQEERIARMKREETIPALKLGDGSKHSSGSGDRMERAILRRMEYEERIAPKVEAAVAEMRAIEDAVSAVPDPMEREVLRLRYMEGECLRHPSWKEIALKLFGDNDERYMVATYRLHARALHNVRNI